MGRDSQILGREGGVSAAISAILDGNVPVHSNPSMSLNVLDKKSVQAADFDRL